MSSEAPAANSTTSTTASQPATPSDEIDIENGETKSICVLAPDFVYPYSQEDARRNLVLQLKGVSRAKLWMVQSIPPRDEDRVRSEMSQRDVGDSDILSLPFVCRGGTTGPVKTTLYHNLATTKHRGTTKPQDFCPTEFLEVTLMIGNPQTASKAGAARSTLESKTIQDKSPFCQSLQKASESLNTKFNAEDLKTAKEVVSAVKEIVQRKVNALKEFTEKLTEETVSEIQSAVRELEEKSVESAARRGKEIQALIESCVKHEQAHSNITD